jgi:hypothetical protein
MSALSNPPGTPDTDRVSRDLPCLRAQLSRVSRTLELPEASLRERTAASGWSALEHIFHLSLANEMTLKNAANLVAERGELRCDLQPLDPRALEVLRRGRIPSGVQAPRFATPPPEPDFEIVRGVHADVCAAAEALASAGELPSGPLGIPHQILGTLSAAQWLRFSRIHTVHHLRILRAVLASR